MKRRVLIAAAEQFELAPIRNAVAGRDDVEFTFVANGPGPKLVGEAVRSAGLSFDVFVSVGLCGGLTDELTIGSIVVGNAVNGMPLSNRPGTVNERYSVGPIASVDYVAGTVDEKRRLRKTGAIAVEMEAAAVLQLARDAGRPFYCIKAVSDLSSEGFVLDLNAARRVDGGFSKLRILGQAFLQPRTAFPELARLKRNGERAANTLGDFVAHCSF